MVFLGNEQRSFCPMQYCSLQHRTLLPSPVTSSTGRFFFCFGSVSLFFLELFLHSTPVAYWTPTDLGSSSFSVLSFCLFIVFMGFSRQEDRTGLPFQSLLQWSTFWSSWPRSSHHRKIFRIQITTMV